MKTSRTFILVYYGIYSLIDIYAYIRYFQSNIDGDTQQTEKLPSTRYPKFIYVLRDIWLITRVKSVS